jgi:hypothetical protein
MKKLAIALLFSCFSFAATAQEESEEIVTEAEVSKEVVVENPSDELSLQKDCGCTKGKGKGKEKN